LENDVIEHTLALLVECVSKPDRARGFRGSRLEVDQADDSHNQAYRFTEIKT
jgi:hypothetical protein